MTTLPLDVVAHGPTRDGLSRLALDLLALDEPCERRRSTRRCLDQALVRALVDGDPDQQRFAASALTRTMSAAS